LDEPLLERVLASLRELPAGEQLLCVDHHDNDFDWSRPPPEAGEQAEQRDAAAAAAAEDESLAPSTEYVPPPALGTLAFSSPMRATRADGRPVHAGQDFEGGAGV
jgi:hypothetical protein